jgi:hypothetical protein
LAGTGVPAGATASVCQLAGSGDDRITIPTSPTMSAYWDRAFCPLA